MKFKAFLMIAALGAAMLPAHAISLDTGEGHRFLIIDIADEDVSYPREIVEALNRKSRDRMCIKSKTVPNMYGL